MDIHNPIPCPSSAAPSQLHSPSFNLRQSAVFIADIYLNGRCPPPVSIQPSLCTKRGPEHSLTSNSPTSHMPTTGGPGSPTGVMHAEWTIFIFFIFVMSQLSATNLKAEDKCGHPSSIKTTKFPPVLFESYVHCLALARAGDTQFTISRENKF